MKLGLLMACLLLVAGGTAACGGDDSSSTKDAPSTDQFCAGLKEFQDRFADPDSTKDLKAYIEKLKTAAHKLDDLGTPKGMSSDARAGFQLTVQGIAGLSDDATLDDIANLGNTGTADQRKLTALDDYVAKTCPELDGATT